MNQKLNKEKLIKGLVAAGIIFMLVISVLLIGSRKSINKGITESAVDNEGNAVNEQVMDDLNAMYDYLSQLDETIYTNCKELEQINNSNEAISLSISELSETSISSMTEQLSGISEYLTDIASFITENKTEFEQFYQYYEDNQQEVESHLSVISGHLVSVSEVIEDSRQDIKDVIAALQENNQESFELVNTVINKVNESIIKLNEDLAGMYDAIQETLEEMQETEETHQKELKSILSKFRADIFETMDFNMSLINQALLTLTDAIDSESDKLSMEISEEMDNVNLHLQSIHNQIVQTQAEITDILTMVGEDSAEQFSKTEENITEVNNSVILVNTSITEIKQDMDYAHEEIMQLLEILQNAEDENHAEVIDTLLKMESEIGESSENNFIQIEQSFQNVSEELNSLHTSISGDFSTMNDRINNNFTFLGRDLADYFASFSQQINSFHNETTDNSDSIKELIAASANAIDQKLQSVFQSVSNGKRLTASALLTKGVTVAEDATFAQIAQAILNIPQKLVIGVQELPGEVSYDYHYHTGTEAQCDGCYTKPVYHVHSSSNCYKDSRCSCSGFKGNQNIDKGCEACGHHYDHHWSLNNGNYVPSSCSLSTSVLNCNKGGTIEKYSLDCGLSDGQIIGAHIVYTNE